MGYGPSASEPIKESLMGAFDNARSSGFASFFPDANPNSAMQATRPPLSTADFSSQRLTAPPTSSINDVNMNGANVSGVGTAPTRDAAMSVQGEITAVRQAVINTVQNGLEATHGSAFAGQAMSQIVPTSGPGMGAATLTAADPTGVVGMSVAAVNDMRAHANHIGNQDMIDAVEQAIAHVVQDPQTPPEIRQTLEARPAEDLIEYIQTPLEQDPDYIAVQKVIMACDEADAQYEARNDRLENLENVTATDIAEVLEQGNTETLVAMMEQSNEPIAPLTAELTHEEPAYAMNAFGVEFTGDNLGMMGPVQVEHIDYSGEMGAIAHATALLEGLEAMEAQRDAAYTALSREEELLRMAAQANGPSMGGLLG